MEKEVLNEINIKLRASIAVTTQNLQVSYEIENRSKEDIYVFDAMFRLEESPVIDSSLVYTVIENDLLTLFRGVLQIPEGLQVEAPDIPFARLLPTGGTHKSLIDAPAPLRFRHPYEWNDREEIRSTRKIRLQIGYVAAKDVNPRPKAKIVGQREVYYIEYRQVIDVQHFLETSAQNGKMQISVQP